MTLRPGELFGIPAGWPDPVYHVAVLRYLLVCLALMLAVLTARARPWVAVLGGILLFEVAAGFWVLALGRPYGLLVDAQATRLAAEAGVSATASDASSSFLAGQVSAPTPWSRLTARLPSVALLLPTLLPLLVVPALSLLVWLLWRCRERAALAALLWLAFSTGDLDAVAGFGFVPGLWSRPEAGITLVAVAGLALAIGRLPLKPALATLIAVALILAVWLHVPGSGVSLLPSDALLLLSVDQGAWVLLGGWGLWRRFDASAAALAAAGALLLLLAAWTGSDPWGAHAFYRCGLLLAASAPLSEWVRAFDSWAAERWPRLSQGSVGTAPGVGGRLGWALLLILTLPSSFLVWWDPSRLDAVAKDSLEPISPVLVEAMAWIRNETPPDAVFLASAEYAPALAALAGRRVLRAPSLATASDESTRLRLERLVLNGRDPGLLLERYGLTHVFITPGDFRDRGIRTPEELDARGGLRLIHADAEGFRIYAVESSVGDPGLTISRTEKPNR